MFFCAKILGKNAFFFEVKNLIFMEMQRADPT